MADFNTKKNVMDKSPLKGNSTDHDLSTGAGGSKNHSSIMENNLAGASKLMENSFWIWRLDWLSQPLLPLK
mgnify:CR=1 FL=1